MLEQSQTIDRLEADRPADGSGIAGTAPSRTTGREAKPAKATNKSAKPTKKQRAARAVWLKQLHTWHWVSAAISLIGMFLFAITGITLNHAETIAAKPQVTAREAVLPGSLLALLNKRAETELARQEARAEGSGEQAGAALPEGVAEELESSVSLHPRGRPAEWSADEVYVAMPGPGSDAWISIDRATGAVTSESTDQGWVSYLNDLHKGRNTGSAWFWFIDVFAVACVVFTLTGLFLLQLHAKHRPSTWPLVAAGAVIPIIILVFFLHT